MSTSSDHDPTERFVGEHSLSGSIAHQLVAEVLVSGSEWSGPQLRSRASELLVGRCPASRRPALAQRAATAVGFYLTWNLPGAEWTFDGAEIAIEHGRVDLVWAHQSGSTLIDEIKSGAVVLLTDAVFDQLDRYAASGSARWGRRFVGVRCLLLQHPHKSVFVHPDRSRSGWNSRMSFLPNGVQP